MKLSDYRVQLGLSYCNEERVCLFMVRLFNYLGDWDGPITDSEYFHFCNELGIPVSIGVYNRYGEIVKQLSYLKPELNKMLFGYIVLVNCVEQSWKKKRLVAILEGCLNSAEILYDVIEDEDGYFVFPKGAKELDEALISQPLQWLEAFPKSREVFVQALKKYSAPNSNDARTIADEFRKALEGFFQEFFNSEKTLENLKSEYGNYMKKRGIPSEISNSLEKTMKLYTDYMNDYVKHQNNTDRNVLEYIMYQTGNIIRLLITLKNSENNN